MTEPAAGVRLQKVLAAAGIASRRASEALISEGRVEVNSEVVLEQGRRVDPEHDVIRVDGVAHPATAPAPIPRPEQTSRCSRHHERSRRPAHSGRSDSRTSE